MLTRIKLPSKKIMMIAAAALFLIIVIIYANREKQALKNPNEGLLASEKKLESKIVELDTDQDGLKDWEEILWGTNPSLADTDGDKTEDGDEVEANRKPARAAPNDSLDAATATLPATLTAPAIKLNTTERIGRGLWERYLAIKLSGGELSADDRVALIQSVVQEEEGMPIGKSYTRTDIKIIPQSDNETLKRYAEAMGAVLERNQSQESELEIINRYTLDETKTAELEKLGTIIALYENVIAEALKIEVPQPLLEFHLSFLNISVAIKTSIMGMQKIASDPIIALDAMGNYNSATEQFVAIMQDLNRYYTTFLVEFNENSPGYSFTHLYE